MEVRIPFKATLPFTLHKAEVDAENRNVYITLCVSDNLLDLQGDRMDTQVLEKIVKLAKEQKIDLRRHHDDPFHIAKSVDGAIQYEGNRVSVFVTFKAVEVGDGEYYPEIKHLLKAASSGDHMALEASVGGWITKYATVLEKGRPVRIIKDAEVDHVAFTPPKSAANPRTGIYQVFIKSLLHAIDSYEETVAAPDDVFVEVVPLAEEEEDQQGVEKSMEFTEKDVYIELEKCRRERMRLSYTKKDLTDLYERARRYGIPPVPTGNIVKPELYIDIEEFADPVNYLFPLTKERLPATINFFRQNPDYILSLYEPKVAGAVFTRVVEKALSEGIEVPYSLSIADALLAEDVAAKLPGFNPNVYRLMKSWAESLSESQVRTAAGLYRTVAPTIIADKEKLEREIEAREEKYGYKRGANAKLTKDKAFETIPTSKFADPVGYNLPITPEWVLVSYKAFTKPEVRALYDADAQKVIFKRILDGLNNIGARIVFDPADPLHRFFIDHPTFIGNDDYKEDENVGAKAEADIVQYAEALRKEYAPTDAPTVAAEAPHYPFVVPGVTAMHPAPKEGKVLIRVLPHFVDITRMKKDDLPVQIIALSELLRRLGIKETWDKPEDTKIRWVGTKEAKNPIADTDERHPEGKAIHECAGVELVPIGTLEIKVERLNKTIASYTVLENGTVIETVRLDPDCPLRKGHAEVVSLGNYLERKIKETFGITDFVYIASITPDFVVWSVKEDTYITPIEITVSERLGDELRNFEVTVKPVKLPAIAVYIPDTEEAKAEYFALMAEALGGAEKGELAEEGEEEKLPKEENGKEGNGEEESGEEENGKEEDNGDKKTPDIGVVKEYEAGVKGAGAGTVHITFVGRDEK